MGNNLSMLDQAILFAVEAHAGEYRKGTGAPYIVHPVEVMKIAARLSDNDKEICAAAVLHDTIEDAGVTAEQIREKFGERVAAIVCAESENKRHNLKKTDTWLTRKQETISHLKTAGHDTKLVCLADKLANMRDTWLDSRNEDESFWLRFNAPDDGKGAAGKRARIGWYYRSIADELKAEFGETNAWKELDGLIKLTFDL